MSNKALVFSAIILLAIISIPHPGFSQTNCDLKKSDNDIKVYLCESKIAKFKTIVVELDVPATLSQYAAAVLDISSYKEWQYKAIDPQLVKKIGDTELFYYSEVQTPWPTANRDFVFHLQMNQNKNTKVVTVYLTEVPDYVPRKEGVVRLPKAHSVLTLTPIDKNNLHIRYVLDVDPGGDIPAWISNMFAAQAPWQTYNNVRERIKAQGENRITVPFIADY